MKFSGLREFRPSVTQSISDIIRYLSTDLATTIRELRQGLRRLSLDDNFEGWIEEDLVMPASQIVNIRNRLSPIVPRYRIVLRSTGSSIDDSSLEWTKDTVYLRNSSGQQITATVAFLR